MPDSKAQTKDPPRLLEVETNREAFLVKLRSFLGTQDQAHQAEAEKLRRIAFGLAATGLVTGYLTFLGLKTDEWYLPFTIFGTLVLLIIAGVTYAMSFDKHDELERARDIQEFFTAVRADMHPRTAVKGRIDLTEATDGASERTAQSPYSNATKCWYRHHWLTLRWAFADGNVLLLELTDLVKTKSGLEIRREHQVKGRLRVNGNLYRAVANAKQRQLRTAVKQVDGGHMVYFWGTLKTHDDLLPELTLLYGDLDPHGAGRRTG